MSTEEMIREIDNLLKLVKMNATVKRSQKHKHRFSYQDRTHGSLPDSIAILACLKCGQVHRMPAKEFDYMRLRYGYSYHK
jgi:hypothetical protein